MPESSFPAITLNASGDLPEAVYESLVQQIEDGSCVLFLGPGAITMRMDDGSYKPVAAACANHLVKIYGLQIKAQEVDSLTYVSSLLLNRSNERVADIILRREVQKFYAEWSNKVQLPAYLELLADLPFRIIINTTPDDYFAELYGSFGITVRRGYYNFDKPDAEDPLYTFEAGRAPLVYNLLGYYKDKPQSMVLSYSDQLNFINRITGQQNEGLPNSLLKELDKPVFHLFMGFDFEDWSLRVLFNEIFKHQRKSMQPFAYKPQTSAEADAQSQVFFQGEFGMLFPETDIEKFITTLVQTHKSMKSRPAGSGGAPKGEILVLHHESADDDGFQALLKYLKTLPVTITSLKDSLGQGDQQAWIRSVVQRCHVVLPLVSIDFFDENNPALPLLDEIVAANNTRNNGERKLLVLPLLLKQADIKDSPFAGLRTLHPSDGKPVLGEGNEARQFAEVTETLKRYVEKLAAV